MGKTWDPATGEPMSKTATTAPPPSSTSKALNTSGLPADWASFVRRGNTQAHLQMAKAWLATMPDKKTYKDFQNWYTQTIAKLNRKALGPQEIIKMLNQIKAEKAKKANASPTKPPPTPPIDSSLAGAPTRPTGGFKQ